LVRTLSTQQAKEGYGGGGGKDMSLQIFLFVSFG
jgi:hypothetical protein